MNRCINAERTSLTDYVLYGLSEGADTVIHGAQGLWMPGRKPGDLSPLGRPLSFPQIILPHKTLTLVRRITYGGFLRTDYEVDFLDAQGHTKLVAQMPAGRICHFNCGGLAYTLNMASVFSFRPVLQCEGMDVARLKETTGFWSVSVRRTYQLQMLQDIEPLAVAAAFFMATVKFY